MFNQKSDPITASSTIDTELVECQKCVVINKEHVTHSTKRSRSSYDEQLLESCNIVKEYKVRKQAYSNNSQKFVRCVMAKWGCLQQLTEDELHDHYLSKVHQKYLMVAIRHYIMTIHLDHDSNIQINAKQFHRITTTQDTGCTTVELDEIGQTINKLYETLTILTDAIQTYFMI
ncbi:unnamed protein product [Didymodactylos carnosus]|uniref:Uncharacterized protein n=1 Tax=Didymodactylos carnosus TaxID=1234261 RepID=A0A815I3Y4_9BILA|nr:unnamed protein product [Didymodactylos carnosus]CAF4237823.1 unnamed protein product [Didymodactylos carnosus]